MPENVETFQVKTLRHSADAAEMYDAGLTYCQKSHSDEAVPPPSRDGVNE